MVLKLLGFKKKKKIFARYIKLKQIHKDVFRCCPTCRSIHVLGLISRSKATVNVTCSDIGRISHVSKSQTSCLHVWKKPPKGWQYQITKCNQKRHYKPLSHTDSAHVLLSMNFVTMYLELLTHTSVQLSVIFCITNVLRRAHEKRI